MAVPHPYVTAILSGAHEPGREAAALVLAGFVLSFLSIRTSTRMIRAEVKWWPGNIETNGLHLHHLVFGISLMLAGGVAGFAMSTPASPWYQLAAAAFGIGAGLTFDEFALWVRLEDVYWSEQGRESLTAVVVVSALIAVVVLSVRPFGLHGGEARWLIGFAIIQALTVSIITFMKGRLVLGTAALFVPIFGYWAWCRLAEPDSPWAMRFYSPEKLERAAARYPPDRRSTRLVSKFFDAIGGKPTSPSIGEGGGAEIESPEPIEADRPPEG